MMKISFFQRLAALFGICLACVLPSSSPALDLITVAIRGTNGTVSGDGLTLGGNFRYSTNAISGTTWVTNSSPAQNMTNLYSQLSLYVISSAWTLQMTNTNTIVIFGAAPITAALTGTWAVLTIQTNSGTNRHSFMTPVDTSALTMRTNDLSDMAYGLGKYPTNSFPTNATIMANYLGTGYGEQTTGNKTLTNSTFKSGTSTNMELRGDLISYHAGDTNGSGISFGQHHLIAGLSGNANLVQQDGEPAEPNDPADIITYYWGNLIYPQFGATNAWFGPNRWFASNWFGGGFYGTTGIIQRLEASGGTLSNLTAQSFNATNTTVNGTNQWLGDVSYPWYELTTLAAGNNISLPIGTNCYVRLSGNAGAAAICGITGPRNGRPIKFLNASAYTVTLAQNTVDPIANNRLVSNVAGDVAYQPGEMFDVVWVSGDGKWRFEVPTAVGTNYVTTGMNQTNFSVWPSSSNNIPLTINGVVNQNSNKVQIVDSAGVVQSAIGPTGGFHIGGASDAGTNNLVVEGTNTVKGNTILSSNLTVSGLATLSSNLNVTGTTTLSSNLSVSGAATLSSNLTVSGLATLSSNLNVTGTATVSSNLNVTGLTTNSGQQNQWFTSSNILVTASNTTSVPLSVALAAAPATNAFEVRVNGSVMASVGSNGVISMRATNSSKELPAMVRIFFQNADSTVTNISTAETSLFGAGSGSLLLDAGLFQWCKAIRIDASGECWGGGTIKRFFLRLGGNSISQTTVNPGGTISRMRFETSTLLSVRANGAAGSVTASGTAKIFASPTTTQTGGFTNSLTSMDLTTNIDLTLTVTNGATTDSFITKDVVIWAIP